MSTARAQQTTTVAATGALRPLVASDQAPFSTYAIQVKGTGGTLTSWTVTIEGSLDGSNWTTIATHNATEGSTVWDATGKPCLQVRANVTALVLNTAPSATVILVAYP